MATVNDILVRVRRKIGDMQKLKFSDEELIGTLNDSIDALSGELIVGLEPEMIKSLTINGQVSVTRPIDFVRFVGQYPIQFVTNSGVVSLKHLDPEFVSTLDVRYFATKPKVTTVTDNVPFEKLVHQTLLVEKIVAIYTPAQVVK